MSNIITVKRANVLLDVPEEQREEYLAKGFDVIDKDGKVLVAATVTNDVNTLHRKLAEAQEQIKILKEENARLNKELDEMAGETSDEDTDEELEQEGLIDPEPTPKKKSSKKS